MMEHCCGSCKYHVPEEKNMVLRALSKYPWPYCSINQKAKPEDTCACLVWTPKPGTRSEATD